MKKLRRAHRRKNDKGKKLRRRALAAGTAAAIALAGGAGLNKVSVADVLADTDNHQLVVAGDSDSDLLVDSEEAAIGYKPFIADQNPATVGTLFWSGPGPP